MSILETDMASLNLVAYSSLSLGSIFKHGIESLFKLPTLTFQKYFIILYQWPLLSMHVFLISIWRQLTKVLSMFTVENWLGECWKMMFIGEAKRERRWWKNGRRVTLAQTQGFICSGYSAFCTHSIKTAVLSSRKIVVSQFWCCWRPLRPLPAVIVDPSLMDGRSIQSRNWQGEERKGKGG